jgi:hypothetical protein
MIDKFGVLFSGIQSLGFDLYFTYKFKVCFRLFPIKIMEKCSTSRCMRSLLQLISLHRRSMARGSLASGCGAVLGSSLKKQAKALSLFARDDAPMRG